MLDDPTLLRRYLASRDEAAFSELVRRHLPLVYGAALRRCWGDTHRAEEIAQVVFTDLARKAERLIHHPSLVGWLHTSTRYAAAAAFRGEQRRRARETEAVMMQENSSPGDSAADWSRLGPVIDAALDQLAESDRQMILLRYFDNQPYAVIGQTFHLSEDTARKRAERALEKLRVLLSRRGITSTSLALGLALSQQAIASVVIPSGLAASITAGALTSAASAAAASGGLLSLLTLANLKLSTAALTGICLAVTVGTTVLAHTVSQQNGAIVVFAAQVANGPPKSELAEQVAVAERRLDETLRGLRAMETKLAALPPPGRQGPIAANRIRSGKVALILANDPEYVRLSRQRMRTYVTGRYAELFAELKLSAERLEALKEILVTYETESGLARSRAMAAGERNPTAEERAALRASTDEALRSLLGDDGLATMRAVETRRSSNPGRVEMGIAADLWEGGHALTADQGKQLAALLEDKIYAPERAHRSGEVHPLISLLPSGLTPAEAAVINELGPTFTQSQRELLAGHFRFEHERHAVEQRISATHP